ncbi:UvrD-helicase domain-containing protein [Actinomycetospora soli]|uniref:UvrD-helicase domain-containing protein n=1 Tax=Actinomycetospora soli TaxID=2893887 RepID=UPI001E509F61|nr:UvrD-helicase domain-containing protein [Actinomycetospora soli]MCD2186622.1 AAA family ATPase [Actinomycetospora soli]
MPTIIMTKWPVKLDGSVRSKAMAFLQKLSHDDTTPGLHVEPIGGSADDRVRTGRVDQFWRAVMFRLDGNNERHYVIHGVWPHDDAITVARSVSLTVNPINGLPQIEAASPSVASAGATAPAPSALSSESAPAAISPAGSEPAAPSTPAQPAPPSEASPAPAPSEPLLVRLGRTRTELTDRLGLSADIADHALSAPNQDAITELAARHEGWIGMALIGLAVGESIESIVESLELDQPHPSSGSQEADLLEALRRPAARAQFSFIEDQEELRQVIDHGDFGAWRVFLHPMQRRYVEKSYSGPFRLSGGAGTGKTVVLVHRARALARRNPQARIVLTTFTTNLAGALRDGLAQLDARVPQVTGLGDEGIYVAGVDALASAVIRAAGADVGDAVRAVLGEDRSQPNGRTTSAGWREVLDGASTSLPPEIAHESFLAAEYALVVLPNRVTSEAGYRRVRRPGRGLALDRAKRDAVWSLIAAYRAQNRVEGTLDFAEAAAVAAAWLETAGSLADHVLVDEGQDLSPAHWQLLRAVVGDGPDDLFIAEDSHQRIYGPRTVLSRYGIKVVGRSQRLTLNYRTTAQNLRYAMSILEGADYVDLEEQPESTGYRSARSGPAPTIVPADSLSAELDEVAKQVGNWVSAGTEPSSIAVLAGDRFHCERLARGLAERGVAAAHVEREQPPKDRVAVMTMHRAKGTEFAKVVLADTGATSAERDRLESLDGSARADTELRRRSLTYVAATRARDELAVIQREGRRA